MKKLIIVGILLMTSLCARHTKDPLASKLHSMTKQTKILDLRLFGQGVVHTAKKYLGKRYVYGANSKYAVDCSSFVQQVYKKHKKFLPRTSREQVKVGRPVSRRSLKPGDLVFFSSKKTRGVAHVGIYIGGGKFIHASSARKRVTITRLSKSYYKKHYKGARRL